MAKSDGWFVLRLFFATLCGEFDGLGSLNLAVTFFLCVIFSQDGNHAIAEVQVNVS